MFLNDLGHTIHQVPQKNKLVIVSMEELNKLFDEYACKAKAKFQWREEPMISFWEIPKQTISTKSFSLLFYYFKHYAFLSL